MFTRCVGLVLVLAFPLAATEPDVAAKLRELDALVLAKEQDGGRMIAVEQKARLREAAERENAAWAKVSTKAEWEAFRDERLAKLRASLGVFPKVPETLNLRVTGTVNGDGFAIENVVYETRPGWFVTANRYRPATPGAAMPGILISHSHHTPKTQGELQDMGMTWARAGCVVLVPDHVGHGERRQHPFRTEKDYPTAFRVSRQDYHFRYATGAQLHLVGESLMGWMVWDLMRGVDVLLAQPGIDKEKIILLGAVAGGGDPAGVTAALDSRITAVMPFNFGGTQPDYATPADAERDFYWFGHAYWESTRCLRRGAADGLAHWVITASVAPRRLVHAHEFAWEESKDPAWPRLQKVFKLTGAEKNLTTAQGQGNLRGQSPESSHCTHIGALHRSRLYPHLRDWFAMPVPTEFSKRRPSEELMALTPEVRKAMRPLHELAGELANVAKRERSWKDIGGGEVAPKAMVGERKMVVGIAVEPVTLETDAGITVPLLLLLPPGEKPRAVVVGVAQGGKDGFLKHRSTELAELLAAGVAVCLPDVRGTGETKPGGDNRRHSGSGTTHSATEWQLGRTLLGGRVRDLRAVLAYLRTRTDVGAVALWGDSLAVANSPEKNLAVPLEADPYPAMAEPLGGLLALLGALAEPKVKAIAVRGGLTAYRSVLASPFFYVPHDAFVPDVFRAGDLPELAGMITVPVRLADMVNGQNRTVSPDTVRKLYPKADVGDGLAAWLIQRVR